jgi:hypothetical protein
VAYRPSRNFEESILYYLETQAAIDWSSLSVEKTFNRVYESTLPVLCVMNGTTDHERVGVGSTSTKRTPQIIIDIFANDDGQRLDLKDWVIAKLKAGCIYYECSVSNNVISRTSSGRIIVTDIDDAPINLDTDKETLHQYDRYRHRITLSVKNSKVET